MVYSQAIVALMQMPAVLALVFGPLGFGLVNGPSTPVDPHSTVEHSLTAPHTMLAAVGDGTMVAQSDTQPSTTSSPAPAPVTSEPSPKVSIPATPSASASVSPSTSPSASASGKPAVVIDTKQLDEVIGTATNPCPTKGTICEWVLHKTDNAWLAQVLGQILPLVLYMIAALIITFFVVKLVRNAISVLVHRSVGSASILHTSSLFTSSSPVGMAKEKAESLTPEEEELYAKEQAAYLERQDKRAHSMSLLLGSIAALCIWVIMIFGMLQTLGVYLTPLLASAGIIGVAVGFGAQSLVKDFLTGMFLQFEGQYAVGDWIKADGVEGEVEHISLRVTQLRDSDGTVYHVPNGRINQVANKSQMWSQGIVDVPVAHEVTQARAVEAIEAAIERFNRDPELATSVLRSPSLIGLNDFETGNRSYRVIIRVAPGKQWGIQRAFRRCVVEVFEERGIPMTQTSSITVAQPPA